MRGSGSKTGRIERWRRYDGHGVVPGMTGAVDDHIVEHLRHILGRVDQIAENMVGVKHRTTLLESGMALVKREVAAGDDTHARQQVSLDRLLQRIERI